MKHWKTKVNVETLENRWVPALILQLDANGNLTGIFGNGVGDVSITLTASDQVNVQEDADEDATFDDLGTYDVPGDLRITFGNTNATDATLDVDFDGNSLSGNLTITLGNATNGYTVNLVDGGGVAGNLSVRTGNGNDDVNLDVIDVGGNLAIDTTGGDDSTTNLDDVTVAGNASVANSDADTAGASAIEGNFTYVKRSAEDVTVNFEDGVAIGGNLMVTMAAAGDDFVDVSGTVAGNVFISFRGSTNGDFDDDGDQFEILGNLVILGSNGADDLEMNGLIGGNFTFTGNGGDDEVDFGDDTTLDILGSNVSLNMGNGDDAFTVIDLTAAGARLSFLGGNGADFVDWSAAIPVVASAFLDGGAGVDACDLSGGTIAFPFVKRNF